MGTKGGWGLDGPLLTGGGGIGGRSGAIRQEINLEAEALVATLASQLGDGALCFIDYGFPPRVLPRQRAAAARWPVHYRQRVHFDR